MNPGNTLPWAPLFPAPIHAETTVTLRFRLVRKHGEPLLLLPPRRRAAIEALTLYPAQTSKARAARFLLRACLQAGLAPGTKPVTVRADPQAAFWRFLRSDDRAGQPGRPDFAVLCGNPRVPGRRFILLVFDSAGGPRKLVKAGVSTEARALIRQEAAFLKSSSVEKVSAPAVLGAFSGDGIEAVALEYAAGKNPDPREMTPLANLLTSWLHPEQRMPLADLPAWRRLAGVAQANPLLRRLESALATTQVRPAILHGDFAPWNIRVDPVTRRWVVLDWERGETAGPPGWDWFHFVIQTETLVHRASPDQVAAPVEALLESAAFRGYARQAGIEDIARPLVLAYLLYFTEVIPPAEGVGPTRELLNLLVQRWQSA